MKRIIQRKVNRQPDNMHRKVLYIGDSKYDSKCAENAGIDFALAVWGSHNKHIKADYFLEKPANLLSAITSEKFY